jgi:DinB superfamily
VSLVKQVLKRQIDDSGVLLLKASSVLSDEEFVFEPDNGASMAWTLGHLAALQDWAIHRVFLTQEPKFSRELREALKGGRPVSESDREKIANRAEVEATFARTQANTIDVLHKFDENDWNKSTPSGCRFPTYGEGSSRCPRLINI